MATEPKLAEYLERVPAPDAIRKQLAANLRERSVLRRLLKLAEETRKPEETRSCK